MTALLIKMIFSSYQPNNLYFLITSCFKLFYHILVLRESKAFLQNHYKASFRAILDFPANKIKAGGMKSRQAFM